MMNTTALSVEEARTQFSFSEGVTYLNSASVGPIPKKSVLALQNFYETVSPEPWRLDELMWAAEEKLPKLGAELLDANPSEVTFGYNTGYGLVLAANGLNLQPGDEILIPEKEFPEVVYPWQPLVDKGVKLRFAKKIDGKITAESFAKEVSERTKVVVCSYVQFYDGYKLPLKEISDVAKNTGAYFIVDGIQGLGMEPISVTKLGIDLFTAGGQKWLLSPIGSGLLYVSQRMREELGSTFTSWLSVKWDDFFDMFQYEKPTFDDARCFSMGSPPAANIIALNNALELLLGVGIENIQSHTHRLLDQLIDALNSMDNYRIISPLGEGERSSILSFTSDEIDSLHQELTNRKFVCAKREGGVRIAPHIYNTQQDIERLISVL